MSRFLFDFVAMPLAAIVGGPIYLAYVVLRYALGGLVIVTGIVGSLLGAFLVFLLVISKGDVRKVAGIGWDFLGAIPWLVTEPWAIVGLLAFSALVRGMANSGSTVVEPMHPYWLDRISQEQRQR